MTEPMMPMAMTGFLRTGAEPEWLFLFGVFGVELDGKEGALGNGYRGVVDAFVKFTVGPEVVADPEVFAFGNAKGHGLPGAGVIVAGGDGGQGLGPVGRGGFLVQGVSGWMR